MISIAQLEGAAFDVAPPSGVRREASSAARWADSGPDLPFQALLADEFALHAATLDYHWNMTGLEFYALHQLLEEQYRWLGETLGAVAKRARAAGAGVRASWGELTRAARINALPGAGLGADEMIAELISLHEAVLAHFPDAASIGADGPTEEFLARLAAGHAAAAATLRSLLETEAGPA